MVLRLGIWNILPTPLDMTIVIEKKECFGGVWLVLQRKKKNSNYRWDFLEQSVQIKKYSKVEWSTVENLEREGIWVLRKERDC